MDEHKAVLVDDVLAGLDPKADGLYIDATFGRGGHTARILETLGGEGRVLALDRDPEAVAAGRLRFASEMRLALVQAAFADLRQVVHDHAGGRPVAGVLFDLGVSSPQLDQAARGFSFAKDGPLDMRMDPARGEPVAAWLARAPVDEMREVIATLGEERFARRVAEAIAAARQRAPIERTRQLAEIVAGAVRTRDGKHPATRTFQALRMHVNDELGQLRRGLEAAAGLLAPHGRLAVIAFHSLEDRLVKDFLRRESSIDPVLAKLPVTPPHAVPRLRLVGARRKAGDAEVAANPRARSAVLRVAERVA